MPSITSHIEQIRKNRGLEAALQEALAVIRRQAEEVNSWWSSRFFEMRVLDGGAKKLWPTTQEHVSRCYDLQDLDAEPIPAFLYCDDDGNLYPVTVGRQERISSDEECPVIFATADMMANGKVVGCVQYSDH